MQLSLLLSLLLLSLLLLLLLFPSSQCMPTMRSAPAIVGPVARLHVAHASVPMLPVIPNLNRRQHNGRVEENVHHIDLREREGRERRSLGVSHPHTHCTWHVSDCACQRYRSECVLIIILFVCMCVLSE